MENLKHNINRSFEAFERILGEIESKLQNGLLTKNADSYLGYAVLGARAIRVVDRIGKLMDNLQKYYPDTITDVPVDDLVNNMTDDDLVLLVNTLKKGK
jgi:hypothetical protein